MIMAMKTFTLLLTAFLVSAGCSGNKYKRPETNEARQAMLTYPYKADRERVEQIDRGVIRVRVGTSSDEVIRRMGNPDEINDTLDKDNWDKKVGFSFVYIKQRDKACGSVEEKNEDLIRIHFNKKKEVTRIDCVTSVGKKRGGSP